jgi:hypothetical protein
MQDLIMRSCLIRKTPAPAEGVRLLTAPGQLLGTYAEIRPAAGLLACAFPYAARPAPVPHRLLRFRQL